jgi:hypothetical protein
VAPVLGPRGKKIGPQTTSEQNDTKTGTPKRGAKSRWRLLWWSLVIFEGAFSLKELATLGVQRGPCLPNPLSTAPFKASLVVPPPAVPGRRFGATVPGPRRVAIIDYQDPRGAAISPLRRPVKTMATRLLIAALVRLVWRYAQAQAPHESCRSKAISKARRSKKRLTLTTVACVKLQILLKNEAEPA